MLQRIRRPRTPLGRAGQTIVEYTVIVVIILGAMIGMRNYIKRGIQGRWKSATDDIGSQYDPQQINSIIYYAIQINSDSQVNTVKGTDSAGHPGEWTMRNDASNSLETKTGVSQVGN